MPYTIILMEGTALTDVTFDQGQEIVNTWLRSGGSTRGNSLNDVANHIVRTVGPTLDRDLAKAIKTPRGQGWRQVRYALGAAWHAGRIVRENSVYGPPAVLELATTQ